jgi:hypothetical protein
MEPTVYLHVYRHWSIFGARLIQSTPYFSETQLKTSKLVAYFQGIGFPTTTLYASLSYLLHSPSVIYFYNWYSVKCKQHTHSVVQKPVIKQAWGERANKTNVYTQPRDKSRQLVTFIHNNISVSAITPVTFQWEKIYVHS